MGEIKQKYGTNGQAVTITLASLANGAMRQSAYIDNSTTLFIDEFVTLAITLGSSGVASDGVIEVRAYASVDGGATYTSGASGSDAAYTGEAANLPLVAVIDANTNSELVIATCDIAAAFGGALTERWGLVVKNRTGAALAASGHSVKRQGRLHQAA